jgi:hypothetical protein
MNETLGINGMLIQHTPGLPGLTNRLYLSHLLRRGTTVLLDSLGSVWRKAKYGPLVCALGQTNQARREWTIRKMNNTDISSIISK